MLHTVMLIALIIQCVQMGIVSILNLKLTTFVFGKWITRARSWTSFFVKLSVVFSGCIQNSWMQSGYTNSSVKRNEKSLSTG